MRLLTPLVQCVGLLISLTIWACPSESEVKSSVPMYTAPATTPVLLNKNQALPELLPPQFKRSKISLLVEKSLYRLTLYYDKKPLKSYPVVLGPEPVADKRREGDGATPEGVFHLRNLYPHAAWSKFMWVDYPTHDSWRKHTQAKAAGQIPPNATIGGEIGIHGVPNNANHLIDERQNWTAGCVSLKNPDIDEIYAVSSKGMRVEIRP